MDYRPPGRDNAKKTPHRCPFGLGEQTHVEAHLPELMVVDDIVVRRIAVNQLLQDVRAFVSVPGSGPVKHTSAIFGADREGTTVRAEFLRVELRE